MPMNYRSTNTTGFVHFGGALVVGVEQESGVEINPTSSGSQPNIQAVGDETNKSLTIQGKGSGGVKIGSSGTALHQVSAYTVQFTAPLLSSGFAAGASAAESTYTVTGVSTGTVLIFTPTNPINALYNVRARCSTVNELVLCFSHNGISTLGSGESTNRGVLLQFSF